MAVVLMAFPHADAAKAVVGPVITGTITVEGTITVPVSPCFTPSHYVDDCSGGSVTAVAHGSLQGVTASDVPWTLTFENATVSGALSYHSLCLGTVPTGISVTGNVGIGATAGVNGAVVLGTFGQNQVTSFSGVALLNNAINFVDPVRGFYVMELSLSPVSTTVISYGTRPGVKGVLVHDVPQNQCNGGQSTQNFKVVTTYYFPRLA